MRTRVFFCSLLSFFSSPTHLFFLQESIWPGNAWWSQIDDSIYLGALPIGKAQALKALGVGLVINTCEEWDGNREVYRELGIEQVRVETIDYTPPQLQHAEQAVTAMVRFLAENPEGKIYVHCKAGRGRSATLLLCYYIFRGMGPLQAQRLLNAKRPQVSSRSWKRKVVKDYVKVHVLGWKLDEKAKDN